MDEPVGALPLDNTTVPGSPEQSPRTGEMQGLKQAEDHCRLIADFTWDWEFWLTPDQAMAYTSPSCERISGYPPSYFESSAHFLEIVHPEDRPNVEVELGRAVAARASHDGCDLRIVCRDGTIRWVSMAYQPVYRDPEGGFAGVRGSIRDVSAAKETEAEVRRLLTENERQRESLELIFNSIADAVIVYDAEGRLVQANPTALETYGLDPSAETMQDIVRRLAVRRRDGQPLPLHEFPAWRAAHGDTVRGETLVLTNGRGEERIVVAAAAPLWADGQLSGSVAVWHDITVRERLLAQVEAERERAEVAAAEAGRRAAELTAAMSSIPGGLLQYDTAGRIVRMNGGARALLRYGRDEVDHTLAEQAARLGMIWPNGVPVPDDQLPVARALRGETVEYQVIGLQPFGAAGKTTWLSASAAPVLDEAGRPIGAVTNFADITELRDTQKLLEEANLRLSLQAEELEIQAEELEVQTEELRQQNEELEQLAHDLSAERARLQALVTNAPEGIVLTDAEARILLVNPAANRLYARSVPVGDRFETHTALRLCTADGTPYDPRDLPLTRSALDGETHANVEMTIVWPDGERRDLLANTAPIRDSQNRVTGAVGVFQDVTGAKELERERERLVVELQTANEQLSEQAEEMEVQAEELRSQNVELQVTMRQLENERGRLAAVLEQMPGGVVIAEATSGQVVLVNRQTEELLRGPYRPPSGPEEYMQYVSFRPDGRAYLPEEMPLARALQSGEVIDNEEIHWMRGDGTWGVQLASARPVRDSRGQITAGVVTFVDITERRAMEEALRKARDQMEQRVLERTADLERANQALQYQAHLLASVHDAIVATDIKGRITAWNRAAETLYGWPADEVVGLPMREVLKPRFLGHEIEEDGRALARDGRLRGEALHARRDGTDVVVEATSMAVADAAGYITGHVGVHRDISHRKEIEAQREAALQALRESEERYRVVSDLTSDYVYQLRVDPDGYMEGTLVTDGFTRLTGFGLDEVKELENWSRFIHPDDVALTVEFFDRARTTGRPDSIEIRMLVKSGGEIWTNIFARPRWDTGQGRVVSIEGAVKDVTERVQARQMLEQRVAERTRELSTLLAVAERLAATLNVQELLDLIADHLKTIVDYSGLVVYQLSDDEVKVLDYRGPLPKEEMQGTRFALVPGLGLDRAIHERKPVIVADMQSDEPAVRAWRTQASPGQKKVLARARALLAVPLMIQERVIGMLQLDHDTPGHFGEREAELALAFANHVAVAMANARLYEQSRALAAMEERQRLARDLHDAVSQTLFSASLTADVLPTLYSRDPVHGEELLAELRRLNRGAMAEMRMLLLELRPSALLEADLATLLRQLGEATAARSAFKIEVFIDGALRLPPEVHVALYRIAQEAMNNVVKHAQATSATISLRCQQSARRRGQSTADGQRALTVEMSVIDDGRGFNLAEVTPGRLGLGIMAERAAAIGANLAIESEPGDGTSVRVTWRSS